MLHVFYIYMNVNIYMFSFVTVSSVLMGLSICWYCCSVAQSCLTMWRHGVTVCQASPSFIISLSLFKLVFFESVMPSDQLILCRPLLLLLQSFPASGSFPVSHVFASGGQSIGASASASVLPMNIQGWFPLGLTGLISLLSKGLSRVFSSTTVQTHYKWSLANSEPVKTPLLILILPLSLCTRWIEKSPRICCC